MAPDTDTWNMRAIKVSSRFVLTVGALCAIWLLLSGKTDAMHVGFGVAGSLVIAWVFFPWGERRAFPILRFLAFVPWQLWQILISNLRVARLVLGDMEGVQPRFIRRVPGVRGEQALTLLGCAITLTPGTLTVDVDGETLFVHALDEVSAEGVEQEVTTERVRGVFGEGER